MKTTTLRDDVLSVYDILNTSIKAKVLHDAKINDAYTDEDGTNHIDISIQPVVPVCHITITLQL